MYRNKKIIVVTPAGRKRYLEILKKYVLNCEFVDEKKDKRNRSCKLYYSTFGWIL